MTDLDISQLRTIDATAIGIPIFELPLSATDAALAGLTRLSLAIIGSSETGCVGASSVSNRT